MYSSTGIEIVYAGRNHRSSKTRIWITTEVFNSLTIQLFDCLREHVRIFISTDVIKSSKLEHICNSG